MSRGRRSWRAAMAARVIAVLLAAGVVAGCGPEPAVQVTAQADLESYVTLVRDVFPARDYVRNDWLPAEADLARTPSAIWNERDPVTLRIGLPWLLNDEEAAWFVADEMGYFAEAGITPEFLRGGPGRNHLPLLAVGTVDVAVVNNASHVIRLRASRTGADVLMIGALLRRGPEIILGLDRSVRADSSARTPITPADLAGKVIGVETTSEYLVRLVLVRHGVPEESVRFLRTSTLEPLIAGRVDFMTAWIVNQPRQLEEAGFNNWTALRLSDHGWHDYADVSVVRREFAEQKPDVVRRYLWALQRGVRYMLDHPEAAARITQRRATDVPLTEEQILRRFALQRDLILGDDGRLLRMDPAVMEQAAAQLARAGLIELPGGRMASVARD